MVKSSDTRKIEQKAIAEFNAVISEVDGLLSDLKDGDKGITFDGNIEVYSNEDVTRKKNYEFKVQVQVKGRVLKTGKKSGNPMRFSLGYEHLRNISKDDGAVLLVCNFFESGKRRRLMYAPLLPYILREYLNDMEAKNKKTKSIPLTELPATKEPEKLRDVICKFHDDQNMQRHSTKDALSGCDLFFDDKLLCYYPGEPVTINHLEGLLSRKEYYYQVDDNGTTVNILHMTPLEIVADFGVVSIPNLGISYEVMMNLKASSRILRFGKSFSLDMRDLKFNFKLCGSLNERIRDLRFMSFIINNGYFLLNGERVEVNTKSFSAGYKKIIKGLHESYQLIRDQLNSMNVIKDVMLDEWLPDEIRSLGMVLNSVCHGQKILLEVERTKFVVFKKHDLKIELFYELISKGCGILYNVLDFKNSPCLKRFISRSIDDGWETGNAIYIMRSNMYIADNFDIDSFVEYVKSCAYSARDVCMLNMQALELINSYDKAKNDSFLDLAEWMLNMAIAKDSSGEVLVYKINLIQIKYRRGKISSDDKKFLIDTKNGTDDMSVKIGCCVLLEELDEVMYLLERYSKIDDIRKYPIGNLLDELQKNNRG